MLCLTARGAGTWMGCCGQIGDLAGIFAWCSIGNLIIVVA